MAKQPYMPFYGGDYIKDTRKLPLSVRGAWVDLLLFMWDEEVRGEIIGTISEFAGMLSCTIEEAEFALNLLKQKKVCAYADLPNGQIKIISRRMKRDVELSKKRSESGLKGVAAKNLLQQKQEFASAKLQANSEYGINNENEYKINKGGMGEKEESGLCYRMVCVFKTHYPKYPQDKLSDYPACLQIAYKIAAVKNWTKESVSNGQLEAVIKLWDSMVMFSITDDWFSTRSISDFNKEFQRLLQKMNKPNPQKEQYKPGPSPLEDDARRILKQVNQK